jgi:hypothetical protein
LQLVGLLVPAARDLGIGAVPGPGGRLSQAAPRLGVGALLHGLGLRLGGPDYRVASGFGWGCRGEATASGCAGACFSFILFFSLFF